MITKITTITRLKQLFIETLLNKTNKVTKVSDESILNGIAYGTAKVAQKSLKEVALVESHLFPEDAFGQNLDIIAQRLGISPRFGASSSNAYVRIVADPGTTYQAGVNIFTGQGIEFELTQDLVIGSTGIEYGKLRAQSTGSRTNVPATTISSVNPAPSGHIALVNEYEATGGRDLESDQMFKLRIRNGANLASRGTLSYLTQVLLKFNQDILTVYSSGVNQQNQQIVSIVTQNGIDLSQDELDQLLINATPYLDLSHYNGVTNTSINVVFENIVYQYIDIDMRIQLVQGADVDEVRRDIQTQITKYLNFNYRRRDDKVEWDDLLQIAKENRQVRGILDPFFSPRQDIDVDPFALPRVRGFVLRDLEGNVLQDTGNAIAPILYPNDIDQAFQTTLVV